MLWLILQIEKRNDESTNHVNLQIADNVSNRSSKSNKRKLVNTIEDIPDIINIREILHQRNSDISLETWGNVHTIDDPIRMLLATTPSKAEFEHLMIQNMKKNDNVGSKLDFISSVSNDVIFFEIWLLFNNNLIMKVINYLYTCLFIYLFL